MNTKELRSSARGSKVRFRRMLILWTAAWRRYSLIRRHFVKIKGVQLLYVVLLYILCLTLEEMKDIVSVITDESSEVDGLIISNNTIDRSSLMNQDFHNEAGGLSGKPLANKSTEMIKTMYKLTKGKIPIIGVGGIFTGQDAYEKILVGASAVQIYSALIYQGPPVVTKIKTELAELLERDGYKNVNEAVGKGVNNDHIT